MACPHEHSAVGVPEREDVSGSAEVFRFRIGSDEPLHRHPPIVGGDTGGGALQRVDGDREGRAQARGVVAHHHGQLQLFKALGCQRNADDAAGVADDEVDGLGGRLLGGHDEVALILAVLVIDDDDHPPLTDLGYCLIDRYLRHRSLP